ncbi:cryptic plasmid protein A [Paraburkholderia sp. J7]|uniref:cryptic plasmid protein A n=1 Tax=Paraburkholderia sp. J7 TaxID=2805438 RepID=UPI002AB67293|nr:cryptic plasmid protein A [Paraburkholderia sp. J7]
MDTYKGAVIINTARDKRTLEYLISKCGSEAVEQACASIAGRRKPYVSNIAKVLGVEIPDEVVITPRDEACEHLSRLKAILNNGKSTRFKNSR